MYFASCFLLVLCVCHVSSKSVFNWIEPEDDHPRLLNSRDSRTDGISSAINRALVAEHLEATSSRTTYEDLMKQGAQHITLSFWDPWACSRTDNFLRVLNESDLSPESTWRIDVKGGWANIGNMSLLADVIHTLPAITELHWDASRLVPSIILESLQKNHPDCSLFYTIPFQHVDDGRTSASLPYNTDSSRTEQNILRIEEMREITEATNTRSILNSKNLYSLKAHIDYRLLYPIEKLDLVHEILLTCPNIRELDLKIEISGCGGTGQPSCCDDPARHAVLAFDFSKHDSVLPPLEVLRLEGYRFDFAINGTHVEPEVNMPLEMANLKAWLEHMDWTHLHSLHLSGPITQVLKLFLDALPSLRHIGIDGGEMGHLRVPLSKYLALLSPLESLSVEDGDFRDLDSLLDVITKHHPTLRSLRLNHLRDVPKSSVGGKQFWHDWFIYSTETVLSSAQLTRLFEICPNLKSLDIDMQTEPGWHYEILDTLLSFPQLKELTLRFPPENSEQYFGRYHLPRQEDEPELTTVMTGLRSYLRERKTGEPFEVLRTFIGWVEFRDKRYEEEKQQMAGSWL